MSANPRERIAPHLRLIYDAATVDRYVSQPPRQPRTLAWSDLECFNGPGTRDPRVAVAIYAKLGLHPILLHGIDADGRCTCGHTDCTKNAGKHPVHKGWQKAELDVAKLDRALARNWRLNVGLRMGLQPSGWTLLAVDVDGDRSLLAPLEQKHGPLPDTLTARTSRGLHLIYRVPAESGIRNRVKLAVDVDVRAEGGQIVVSPSRHVSGTFYTWTNIREPAELFQ